MSNNHRNKKFDIEQALVTLDQLSQTVEVMDSVISRLKRQLNLQKNQALQIQTQAPEPTQTPKPVQTPIPQAQQASSSGNFVTSKELDQEAAPNERVLH